MRKLFLLLIINLITAFCLLANPLVSMANVRIEWEPGCYGGPFYASFGSILPDGSVFVIHTDEWAAIPFYRNPACVPEDFNLVEQLDFNALNCYSLVAGFEVWENGPGIDLAPIQISFKAAEPMPIYFIPWDVLEVALEDYMLTMPELRVLEGVRIGIATFYTETWHVEGGAQQVMGNCVVKGDMADNGDKFELKYAYGVDYKTTHVKIDFKPAKSAPVLKSQSKLATTWGEMKGR